MRRKTVRITPLGYIVLIIIVLVMLVSIYFIVWSMRGPGDKTAESTQSPISEPTPTPSLAPISQTTPPVADTPVVTAPPADTATVTPKQDDTPEPATKTPSPEQIQTAVDGTLNSSGVYMRSGPGKSYARVGTYSSGTQLKVYEVVYGTGGELDYYFVKIVKENIYGYIAAKFVDKAGLLPGENATPTPKAIAGTVPGTVSASSVALRTVPSKEDNEAVGQLSKGDQVLIYFKTGDFYYIQVVATGEKYYAYASYITPSTTVPTGTPVP